jgi:hypothetical protein
LKEREVDWEQINGVGWRQAREEGKELEVGLTFLIIRHLDLIYLLIPSFLHHHFLMLVWCLKEWTPLTSKCNVMSWLKVKASSEIFISHNLGKMLVCAQPLSESHLIGADEGLGDRLQILILLESEKAEMESEWELRGSGNVLTISM